MSHTDNESIRLGDDLWGRLLAVSENEGITPTVIIQDAIQYYLERVEN